MMDFLFFFIFCDRQSVHYFYNNIPELAGSVPLIVVRLLIPLIIPVKV
jgi:hypothetical protein